MTLTSNEQIAPELAQALIVQATARGLTVNGYLRQVLGLNEKPQAALLAPRRAKRWRAKLTQIAVISVKNFPRAEQ